jgi:hypothetical protein
MRKYINLMIPYLPSKSINRAIPSSMPDKKIKNISNKKVRAPIKY